MLFLYITYYIIILFFSIHSLPRRRRRRRRCLLLLCLCLCRHSLRYFSSVPFRSLVRSFVRFVISFLSFIFIHFGLTYLRLSAFALSLSLLYFSPSLRYIVVGLVFHYIDIDRYIYIFCLYSFCRSRFSLAVHFMWVSFISLNVRLLFAACSQHNSIIERIFAFSISELLNISSSDWLQIFLLRFLLVFFFEIVCERVYVAQNSEWYSRSEQFLFSNLIGWLNQFDCKGLALCLSLLLCFLICWIFKNLFTFFVEWPDVLNLRTKI